MNKKGYNNDCIYCSEDKKLEQIMTKICQLNLSNVYLFNDQLLRGRCVVAYKEHVTELFQLSQEKRKEFMDEVARVAEVIYKNLNPQKINYVVFGDIVSHLHFHIIPKYEKGPLWGFPYFANPASIKKLPEKEFQDLINILKNDLIKK